MLDGKKVTAVVVAAGASRRMGFDKLFYELQGKPVLAHTLDAFQAHPLVDAVVLALRIRELGADLMIGDDSLVGPSASVWQQLAAGLGARWVEATEKRNESDFYYRCVRSLATDSSRNPIGIELKNGFGLDLDEGVLAEEADRVVEVKQ